MFTAEKGTLKDYGYELITLSGAGHEVRILPENGFNVWYWTYEGKEIFMKPVDISIFGTKYGIPVLFPTPNRIKNGTYTWQGKEYTMKKRGQTILIHGLVKDEPFAVTALTADEDSAACTARIEIDPAAGIVEGWPWKCSLEVTYKLDADGLHMAVRAENESDSNMPFGFAVHPYFSKRGNADNVFLKVPVKRVYEADDAKIPTGKIVPAEGGMKIWDDFHSVESLYLDNVFRGMTSDMESLIRYEDIDIRIKSSDCFRNAVVYTPHDRPGFCIEPQTNATNFLNLHAEGYIDESGLMILPAGKTFTASVEYIVEKRA